VGWSLGVDADQTDYLLEGSAFIAGAAVQWMRDGIGIIRDSSEVEAGHQRARFGRPHRARVRGPGRAVLGPVCAGHPDRHHAGTGKAHIARAALEGVAYQNVDVLSAMQDDAGIALSELRVDGGAARNDMLMQFQADILNVPVVRPVVTETTALGAAYLAGLAVVSGNPRKKSPPSGRWDAASSQRWRPTTPDAAAQMAARRGALARLERVNTGAQWRMKYTA
jgi:glycerol kinase